jgi:hypothetical protein
MGNRLNISAIIKETEGLTFGFFYYRGTKQVKAKRKQYKILQVKFKQITVKDGKLTIEEDPRLIPNSENLFYDLIFRLQGRAYDNENPDNNQFDEFIILKASELDTKDEESIKTYKRIMLEGVWYKDRQYIRQGAIKSASMSRTQKTLLIREDLKDKINEHTSLDRKPEKTIISKFETAKGLLLSSAILLEDCMPKIVIIPDHEVELKRKVRIIEEYNIDPEKMNSEELQYLADKEAEKKRWEEIHAEVERCKEIFTESYLRRLPRRSYDNRYTYKSRNGWKTDNNRRVVPEEIANPKYFIKFNDKAYPCYHLNQTEEIKTFNIEPYSIGLEIKEYDNYSCIVNAFDGMGCADTSWMKKISDKLGLTNTTQGIQIRLPFIKGYIVSFPIKTWATDNEVRKIKDIWGTEWDLFDDKIDMILCESCFKAKLDKSKEGIQQWLFSSMKDYYDCLEKYEYNKVGIAAYTKSKYQKEIYTPITYQHLYAFNFDYDDISKIVQKTGKLGAEIKNSKNIAYIKAYLNMLASENDSEEQDDDDNLTESEVDQNDNKEDKEYVNVIHKAIDLNHRMLFDPHIRNFLVNQARRIWRGLLLGRAYIKGNYIYAAGDTIAFMEHAFGQDVIGFLGKDQLFCAGKSGEHIIIRNPLTHYSEVLKAEFITSENKYIKYLDNVCQFPAGCDLSMARLNLDYDGDKVLVVNNSTMLKKMIPADVIYNPGDKSTADPLEYNINNILEYEKMNLDNLTGRVTNIDTYFSNKAMERNEGLESRDFELTLCKYLQGLIIDSVKSMKKISIPEELNVAWKKPYFLCHKYGDYKNNPKNYQSRDKANSPFNEFVIALEDKIKKTFKTSYGDIIDIEYLDIQDTKALLQDQSKCSSDIFFKTIKDLQPVYEEYIKRKDELSKKGRKINSLDKSDESKEEIKLLNEEYKQFYDDIKSKCREICSNESVLATCCVEIAYNYTKNKDNSGFKVNKDYTFPWRIVPEGILENLKIHEDNNKIDVIEVRELNYLDREFKGQLRVKNGIGMISDVKIRTELIDGNYSVYNILGQHFTDVDVIREEEINIPVSESIGNDAGLKPLINYSVKLIRLDGKEPEHLIEKMKNGFILKMRDKDVAVYVADEYLASIRKEDVNNLELGVRLTDYVNMEFYLNDVIEISETKKSLIIKISTK